MSHRFAGIYTPIVTPFTPAGDVDERGLAGNVDRYLGTPLTGLVVLGSNGEAAQLEDDEADAVQVHLVEGDALRIPAADETFGVVTIAFGLRNLESVEEGLSEIYRVLRREGRAAVLEFSHPRTPVFRGLFNLYFTRLLPRIGGAISGSRFAYQYLPDSVREFPDQGRLRAMMEAVGFSRVRYYNLFGGVAALHLGDKK